MHTARKRFETFPNITNVQTYVKRPIPIKAVQINEPFEVVTLEGILTAEAGDYLIQGIKGEIYSCKKEIFEESYRAG